LKAAPHRVPVPATGVAVEVIEEECLAYHPEHPRVFYLNASAALIWGLCDGVRPTDEICRMIQEGYPDAPENLPDEVLATLSQLEEYGLVAFK
jgi:hypothetical protein